MMDEDTSSSTAPCSGGGQLSAFLVSHSIIAKPLLPLHNNIASALLTVAYVKCVMEVSALIRVKYEQPEFSRKFLHVCACSYVIWWPLFDSNHWSWRLNVTVPFVMSLRLLYKGAILKDPEDEDVHTMSRTSSPSELLFGPLQMCLILVYVGLRKFMTTTGLIIMAAFVGDAAAAVIGLHYGRHRYKVALGGEKSVEGTIGCAFFTMIGISCYCYMCSIDMLEWRVIIAVGITAALVEATALKNWDNVFLCVMMELMSLHLPKLL